MLLLIKNPPIHSIFEKKLEHSVYPIKLSACMKRASSSWKEETRELADFGTKSSEKGSDYF